MRRLWNLLIGLALALALVTSCAQPNGAAQSGAVPTGRVDGAISIKDDVGRTVKLERPAAKIVSLAPSNTELVFAVGAGDQLVGVDDYSDYPVEAKSREKVGGFATINLEKVIALGADLVLATNIHEKTLVPELERRGVPVVVVQPKNVEAVLASLKMVGQLAGKEQQAEEAARGFKGRLDFIVGKVKTAKARPRVYFELDPKLFTVGPGSFVDDMVNIAGGQNIAADAQTQWPQLSDEALLVKDPEVIILGDHYVGESPEKVKARPGWQAMSAVKAGRIFGVNADLTNRPGPRVVQGLEELARAIQPELFR